MANITQVAPSSYAPKTNKRFWSRPRSRRAGRVIAFYAMISPWLIGFLLLGVIPLIVGMLASFTNYDGLNVDAFKWLGMRNYSRVFQDSEALYAFRRTLLWSALNVPIWLALSFTLALILNQGIRARGFFRTLFYLPSIIPAVGAVWAWRLLLDPNRDAFGGEQTRSLRLADILPFGITVEPSVKRNATRNLGRFIPGFAARIHV